jgi:alkanesulfonate monooxygenase SsuD/methylene tetrahydromethanopterin reductase-like flavin-dependent oxidoreductase (luciferase family)
MVFADLNYISDTMAPFDGPSLRYAVKHLNTSIPLLVHGAVTKHIGPVTFSTSHSHPFYAARLWATIDHLTAGERLERCHLD